MCGQNSAFTSDANTTSANAKNGKAHIFILKTVPLPTHMHPEWAIHQSNGAEKKDPFEIHDFGVANIPDD